MTQVYFEGCPSQTSVARHVMDLNMETGLVRHADAANRQDVQSNVPDGTFVQQVQHGDSYVWCWSWWVEVPKLCRLVGFAVPVEGHWPE